MQDFIALRFHSSLFFHIRSDKDRQFGFRIQYHVRKRSIEIDDFDLIRTYRGGFIEFHDGCRGGFRPFCVDVYERFVNDAIDVYIFSVRDLTYFAEVRVKGCPFCVSGEEGPLLQEEGRNRHPVRNAN